ncbi:MAG: polysaccharide pyruvyl transferase family protein [Anaerolineales bacterium]|nr:polysaccharide pyruvyl transferase family protein [Anaerolineales bacterium]
MPNILILNDTRDQPNWGSQACAQALIEIIQARIPQANVETIPAGVMLAAYRQLPGWMGGRLVKQNRLWPGLTWLTTNLVYTPSVADEYEAVAYQWLSGRGGATAAAFLRALGRADAVVFNAEGSTYRVNHCAKLGLFMLWFAKAQADVPALFLNGTVALTAVDAMLPGMVRKTFRVIDGIAVREPKSRRNVEHFAPGVPVRMVPDSVFNFVPQMAESAGPAVQALRQKLAGQPYFCLSASMLPMDFYRSGRRSAAVRLITELKRLVPQAVLAGKDHGDQWLKDLAEATDSLFFGQDKSYHDLMALLSNAAFLVSGRYHNVIMASIVGCPAVPLTTTSPKMQGLCEVLEGAIGQPFDVTELNAHIGAIVATARAYLEAGEAKREQLRCLTTRLRAETFSMGDMVNAALQAQRAWPVLDATQLYE